jgi:hypothetical protein
MGDFIMASQEQYNQVVEEISNNFETLETFKVDEIVRERELGSELSFASARETVVRTIELFKRAKIVSLDELPFNILNNFVNQLKEAIQRFQEFKDFNPNQNNPVNQRNALISQLENQYDGYYQSTFPLLTANLLSGNDLSIQQAKLDSLLQEFQDKQKETIEKSDGILGNLQDTLSNAEAAAAQVGVSKHSSVFKMEASKHEKEAKTWLIWSVAVLLLIVSVASILLWLFPGDSEKPNKIVQYTVTKLVVLSTMFYGLSICNKNYKAHRHNALLNQHRQNALTTFETFSNAANPDLLTKNAVLLEATRTIFSTQQTGYLSTERDQDSNNRFVEIIKSVANREI